MKLVFDCEMTGTNEHYDELLQVSIVNEDGDVLYNEYFQPEFVVEWPRTQEIHGISPEDVKNKPHFYERKDEIQSIFDQADELIGYNTPCDLAFLRKAGINIPDVKITDVMVEFSEVLQNKSGKRFIRSQSLSNCANYYHFEFKAHDSLNDALATLHCYKEIHKDDWLEDMKSSDGMWSF